MGKEALGLVQYDHVVSEVKPSPLRTSSFLVNMFMRLSSWTMRRGAFQTEGSSWEVVLEPQFPEVTHNVPGKGLAVGDEQDSLGIASLDKTLEECRLTRTIAASHD
ncbi:MAG: hypothetical protein ACKPKO_13665, partial [Candidatus Fonsibacter sp.]